MSIYTTLFWHHKWNWPQLWKIKSSNDEKRCKKVINDINPELITGFCGQTVSCNMFYPALVQIALTG